MYGSEGDTLGETEVSLPWGEGTATCRLEESMLFPPQVA